MPYGKLALDTIETSGNLAITGNTSISGDLATGNLAITGNVTVNNNLTVNGDVTTSRGTVTSLVSGIAQTASGTSVTFTGIPSWVKRITVMVNGLSLSGTGWYGMRLGTSSGIITTGYSSTQTRQLGSGTETSSSSGMFLWHPNLASETNNGQMIITKLQDGVWIATGQFSTILSTNYIVVTSAGILTGAGTIDRVSVISGNGTDTFDAGSINIMYE